MLEITSVYHPTQCCLILETEVIASCMLGQEFYQLSYIPSLIVLISGGVYMCPYVNTLYVLAHVCMRVGVLVNSRGQPPVFFLIGMDLTP